jgi:prepilin-type N-terminal cleavage/methylation domain-containing protein
MKQKGFTLIEIIVAIGIFTAVITMALATFLNISNIQRKAGALRAINDNLNFSLELMSREIRSGKDYCPSFSCSISSFKFTNSQGEDIVYGLNNFSIERSVNGGSPLRLTSPEIKIDNLEFIVPLQAESPQPRVTIILNGSSVDLKAGEVKLNIQTTISQRKLGQ